MPSHSHRLTVRPPLGLFFCAFLVYNLNLRPITSGDTAPAALLPFSILLDHTITFDRYAPWLATRYDGNAYFFHRTGEHLYSQYPILQPLLLTPFYTPLLLAPELRRWPMESLVLLARVLEKIAASLIAAASVAFLFCLLRRYLDKRRAALLALLFAFATNTWSTASQALWQHGMSQLMIVLSLLCLERFLEDQTRWRASAGAGLFAALSVGMRPTNFLFFGLSAAVLLLGKSRWKLLASYAASGLIVGAPLALYNRQIFGDFRGGYAGALNGDFFSGLSGLLLSPARGLFVYSPVFLFLFPAVYLWFRSSASRARTVYLISLLFSIAHVALHAKWPVWWAGDCFGPRFLTDALPCLTILLVPLLPLLDRGHLVKAAFVALCAFSLSVQCVGTFSYPRGGWDHSPASVGQRPERLWDWKDNPIRRDLAAGVNLKGYRFLNQQIASRLQGRQPELRELDIHIQ